MSEKLSSMLGPRVSFVDESIFGINWFNVSEIMINSVQEKGSKTPVNIKLLILSWNNRCISHKWKDTV